MPHRSGKPRWRVRCSIGRRNWVVRSPMRSAESGVQGTTASSRPFVQQTQALGKIGDARAADRLLTLTAASGIYFRKKGGAPMIYKGIARGNVIQLEDECTLPEGTRVSVIPEEPIVDGNLEHPLT